MAVPPAFTAPHWNERVDPDESIQVIIFTAYDPKNATYEAAIEIRPAGSGEVVTLRMNDFTAHEYAEALIDCSVRADTDAAVCRQLQADEPVDLEAVGYTIAHLRGKRLPKDYVIAAEGLPAIGVQPGVNDELEPFVTVMLDGVKAFSFSPDETREQAMHLLECTVAARYDRHYHEFLTAVAGFVRHDAAVVVNNLSEFRPGVELVEREENDGGK